ncbi:Os09g0398550 [Oryza sativa Japonica Group]|uniref:Os09g0398550 protein n=1 Tax=Oryza sativa subsp. japonica TaxID=39947 RepID=A0A0P0XLE3_ORYSJ|nr:Os09g0398550 [Oryza sativa Japonica Group]
MAERKEELKETKAELADTKRVAYVAILKEQGNKKESFSYRELKSFQGNKMRRGGLWKPREPKLKKQRIRNMRKTESSCPGCQQVL